MYPRETCGDGIKMLYQHSALQGTETNTEKSNTGLTAASVTTSLTLHVKEVENLKVNITDLTPNIHRRLSLEGLYEAHFVLSSQPLHKAWDRVLVGITTGGLTN